jgi:hypothetical protein
METENDKMEGIGRDRREQLQIFGVSVVIIQY